MPNAAGSKESRKSAFSYYAARPAPNGHEGGKFQVAVPFDALCLYRRAQGSGESFARAGASSISERWLPADRIPVCRPAPDYPPFHAMLFPPHAHATHEHLIVEVLFSRA